MTETTQQTVLEQIVTGSESVEPGEVESYISQKLGSGFALVEAISAVFWATVSGKGLVIPENVDTEDAKPQNWLSVRSFNAEKEVRLLRRGEQFQSTIIDDQDLVNSGNTEYYRETPWMLFGKVIHTQAGFHTMREFQVSDYALPEIPGLGNGKNAMVKVRQYIDYDNQTGQAQVVGERFLELVKEGKDNE